MKKTLSRMIHFIIIDGFTAHLIQQASEWMFSLLIHSLSKSMNVFSCLHLDPRVGQN